MSVQTVILLAWIVGLPAAFYVLLLVYPPYLRRRASRPSSALASQSEVATATVIPLTRAPSYASRRPQGAESNTA